MDAAQELGRLVELEQGQRPRLRRRPAGRLPRVFIDAALESTPVGPPGPPSAPVRVLMLTATAGFRHDSIVTARQVLTGLGAAKGEFAITATEDVAAITATTLATYDVLFFALTSGELAFTAEQKAAILAFVSSGKGFLGAHSATDTLYQWPRYGALIGAYFKEHRWTQTASVIVEDRAHPATTGLGDRFSLEEEFYTFRETHATEFRSCCGSTRDRSDHRAITRSPGCSRMATAACTTTRSGTSPRRDRPRFQGQSPPRFGGRPDDEDVGAAALILESAAAAACYYGNNCCIIFQRK